MQQGLLLPVPYFLLTFTLPAELRQIASQNQKLIYNLLFRASAQATQHTGQRSTICGRANRHGGCAAYLDPQPALPSPCPLSGSWRRDRPDGHTWLPARKNFFLPVKALSKLFRAAFQRALQKTALYTQFPPKVWRKRLGCALQTSRQWAGCSQISGPLHPPRCH